METLFIGKNLLFLLDVESTNTYAMDLLRNVNAIEGTVVYTDNQTNGKGQRGSIWNSQIASNVTASVILKPSFLTINQSFYLSKISALAVYDVLTEILPDSQYGIKIKWPNDILVDKRKIAGILIENNFQTRYIQHSVLGIGLNVNQTEFDGLAFATSLKTLAGKEFDRSDVLGSLCRHLEKWYLKLKESKFELIDEIYLHRLFGLAEVLPFKDPQDNHFEGKIVGVTIDGKLQLELLNGEEKKYEVKEIKLELHH